MEFFSAVAQVTGQPLRFNVFDETAKLHSLVFDAEAAQMQGCGDALVAMKVNAGVSGITTTDPLELVLYVAKTCVIHFRRYASVCIVLILPKLIFPSRNIDSLPKSIPRQVIDRLKSFPNLSSDEDVLAWKTFCQNSQYKEVVGMLTVSLSRIKINLIV